MIGNESEAMPNATSSPETDVAVVIRAAGERTLDACRAIVEEQVSASHVAVIEERPFEAALRRCYEIGVDFGLTWTLTVDADVLLRRDAVRRMLAAAEEQEDRVFQVQPWIYDKSELMYREVGCRLYRTAHLGESLECVPDPGTKIRPEYEVVKRMSSRGYAWRHVPVLGGIHDFEQYYGDLFRKGFVHGRKNLAWIARVVPQWRQLIEVDYDYRVTLQGFIAGALFAGSIELDIQSLPRDVSELLARDGVEEKGKLPADAAGDEYVEAVLRAAGPAPSAIKTGPVVTPANAWGRLSERRRQIGWARLAPWLLGATLVRSGDALKRWCLST